MNKIYGKFLLKLAGKRKSKREDVLCEDTDWVLPDQDRVRSLALRPVSHEILVALLWHCDDDTILVS
jgi:hypothetical protein